MLRYNEALALIPILEDVLRQDLPPAARKRFERLLTVARRVVAARGKV